MFFLFYPHPSTRNTCISFSLSPNLLDKSKADPADNTSMWFPCLNFSLRMCNSLWAERQALAACLRSHKKSHATHATVCFSGMCLSGTAVHSPPPVIEQACHSIPKTRRVLSGSLTYKGSATVTYLTTHSRGTAIAMTVRGRTISSQRERQTCQDIPPPDSLASVVWLLGHHGGEGSLLFPNWAWVPLWACWPCQAVQQLFP